MARVRARARYFFGRINIIAGRQDRAQALLEGLRSPTVLPRRGQRWQFLQIAVLKANLGTFYTGYLGKYKPEAEEEVAVPDQQDIGDATVENRITAKARFFLHEESHLIAYHPVGGLITRQGFCSKFAELIEDALGGFFFRVEIEPIDDENRVRDAISAFDQLSKIRIRLHPSNPSTRDLWRRTDERLRRLEASDYEERYQAKPQSGGLNIEGDDDINSKLAMAEDGYGWVQVSGTIEGKEQTVSTDDHPVSASAPPGDVDAATVLESLSERFSEIIARFRQ